MRRTAAVISIAIAAASIAAPAAEAKHRKPITKTFAVRGTLPWPADLGNCDTAPHGKERHVEKFRAPEAGVLTLSLTNFYGDFDLALYDGKGTKLYEGNNEAGTSNLSPSNGTVVETLKAKIKRPMALEIHVCNFAASPDADGSYTFTYER